MESKSAAVVGGGLVGCLAAVMLSTHGFKVDLYEGRPDPRGAAKNPSVRARSINLAVSNRGIESLKSISPELAEKVLVNMVPMKGRMIHTIDGQTQSQLYGLHGEYINSIDREVLNNALLSEVSKLDKITTHFDTKLVKADLNTGMLIFQDGTESKVDLIVGADGAYSRVRQEIQRLIRMNLTQEYINHDYLELSIPAGSKGEFQLNPEHLHIWPRKEFMLIALPNDDKSFTCTLFAPPATFSHLSTESHQLAFFQNHFPDALPLITPVAVVRAFAEHPISPLMRLSCSPYHYKDRAVILGDSSHTMPPFYGQGLNCGWEDVRVLHELLQKHDLATALEAYSQDRHADLLAIQELALNNYTEMSTRVIDPFYRLRKAVDGLLARSLGEDRWCPLYIMVTFKDKTRYSVAKQREQWQAGIVDTVVKSVVSGGVVGAGIAGWFLYKRYNR